MTARILIVDDAPANTRLLDARLSADYYQTAIAADGAAALRLVGDWQPDLILLDVMMPDIDGFEICRRLKADPLTLHIPVVMLTAISEPSGRVRGLDAGADDFLTKPVDYGTLLARVRSLVRLKHGLDAWRVRGKSVHPLGLATEALRVPSVQGARALVVDDLEFGARAVQEALARDGILTGHADGAEQALALTAAIGFDLIVISLGMTAEDPLRLASRLRAADATHDIPQLLIAEPEQREIVLRGFDIGANDWLIRPIDENELRVRSRNQIRRKYYRQRLRAELEQALELVLTDPLTGFYNQRYLMGHLRGLMAASRDQTLCVLMIDIDHLKAINETSGHAGGDEALRSVADALRRLLRVTDQTARYSGAEFVVTMPRTSAEDALQVAERLCAAVARLPFRARPGVPASLTVSVGIAASFPPHQTPERLLQQAHASMRRAKQRGRNRVDRLENAGAAKR